MPVTPAGGLSRLISFARGEADDAAAPAAGAATRPTPSRLRVKAAGNGQFDVGAASGRSGRFAKVLGIARQRRRDAADFIGQVADQQADPRLRSSLRDLQRRAVKQDLSREDFQPLLEANDQPAPAAGAQAAHTITPPMAGAGVGRQALVYVPALAALAEAPPIAPQRAGESDSDFHERWNAAFHAHMGNVLVNDTYERNLTRCLTRAGAVPVMPSPRLRTVSDWAEHRPADAAAANVARPDHAEAPDGHFHKSLPQVFGDRPSTASASPKAGAQPVRPEGIGHFRGLPQPAPRGISFVAQPRPGLPEAHGEPQAPGKGLSRLMDGDSLYVVGHSSPTGAGMAANLGARQGEVHHRQLYLDTSVLVQQLIDDGLPKDARCNLVLASCYSAGTKNRDYQSVQSLARRVQDQLRERGYACQVYGATGLLDAGPQALQVHEEIHRDAHGHLQLQEDPKPIPLTDPKIALKHFRPAS